MGITFCIGDNLDEAVTKETFVNIEDEVLEFLCSSSERTRPRADLLLGLDPYGDKVFNEKEIKEVIEICELLSEKYEEEEIKECASELKVLCETALQNQLSLFALGD